MFNKQNNTVTLNELSDNDYSQATYMLMECLKRYSQHGHGVDFFYVYDLLRDIIEPLVEKTSKDLADDLEEFEESVRMTTWDEAYKEAYNSGYNEGYEQGSQDAREFQRFGECNE